MKIYRNKIVEKDELILSIYKNNRTIPLKNNVEDLRNWMGEVNSEYIDAVFEFLIDRELLNEQGLRVAYKFWKMYIKGTL